MLEPVKTGMMTVLPWRVGKVSIPPLMVEPRRVDTIMVLPCAVEKVSVLAFSVDVIIENTVRLLP